MVQSACPGCRGLAGENLGSSESASWMASGSSLRAQDCRSYIRIQNLKEPSGKVPYGLFGISCMLYLT